MGMSIRFFGSALLAAVTLAAPAEIMHLKHSNAFRADELDLGEVKHFVEGGGILVSTGVWEPAIWDFLAKVDGTLTKPGWARCRGWDREGTSEVLPAGKVPHPLVSFPNLYDDADSDDAHFLPNSLNGWTILAECSEGFPVMLYRPVGKGGIIVSLHIWWSGQLSRILEENFNVWSQLRKAGLQVKSAKMTEVCPGRGRIEMTLAAPAQGTVELLVVAKPADGEKLSFAKTFTGTTCALDYEIPFSGPARFGVAVRVRGKRTILFKRDLDLPPPVSLELAAGNGVLPANRRMDEVSLVARLYPTKAPADGCSLRVAVTDAIRTSKAISTASIKLPEKGAPHVWRFRMKFPKTLPPGKYRVAADLKPGDGGAPLGKGDMVFEVLAQQKGECLADSDGCFIRNGKPFFPLGVYHVLPKEYEVVKGLGFNFIQAFKHQMATMDGIHHAEKQNLSVLVEGSAKDAPLGIIDRWRDTETTAFWYVADEPCEKSEDALYEKNAVFHDFDKHRLTYIVSNRPDLFPWFEDKADIFACDCYGSMGKCVNWLRRYERKLPADKPFVFIPNTEPSDPRHVRAQAFLGIAHGARGLIWYCWDEYGGTGEVGLHDKEELKAEFRKLLPELAGYTDVLTAVKREKFEKGPIHGIVLGEKPGPCRAFMVNVRKTESKASLKLPGVGTWSHTFGPFEAVTLDCSK